MRLNWQCPEYGLTEIKSDLIAVFRMREYLLIVSARRRKYLLITVIGIRKNELIVAVKHARLKLC